MILTIYIKSTMFFIKFLQFIITMNLLTYYSNRQTGVGLFKKGLYLLDQQFKYSN